MLFLKYISHLEAENENLKKELSKPLKYMVKKIFVNKENK